MIRRALLQLLLGMPLMGSGDGLVPPLNAPPAGQVLPGVQPGVSGQVVVAQRVIVFGPSGSGVFVYSPTPGAGNLVESIAAGQGTDPYGNTYHAGFTSYAGPTTYTQMTAAELAFILGGFTAIGNVNAQANGSSGELVLGAPQNSTDNGASMVLRANPSGTPAVVVTTPLAAIQPGSGIDVPEVWHPLTVPTTGTNATAVTGTARVKLLAEQNCALLDVSLAFTGSAAGPFTITLGNLPASPVSYAPLSTRRYAAGLTGTYSAPTQFGRMFVSSGGGLQAIGPSPGAAAATFDFTGIYPLD